MKPYIILSTILAITCINVQSQFVAFNDHLRGPNTHPNATDYNLFGTPGGTPSNTGYLKDITTGRVLPVTLTIVNNGAATGTASGAPSAGTPAYQIFNGYIDFGTGDANHAALVESVDTVDYIFTGLDPNKRYDFVATSCRGSYSDRWSLVTLMDALSFSNAHSSGILTSAQYPQNLATNQVAINSGGNTAGDIIYWKNIAPSSQGTFTVRLTQYLGPIPGGTAGGPYGYQLMAIKLEEFTTFEIPVSIVAQPQSQTVGELEPATFSISVNGIPTPFVQWFKNDQPLANETNLTLYIPSVLLSDNGSIFYARATNSVTNVVYWAQSSNAVLNVTPDTNPPVLISAIGSYPNNVTVMFSEKVLPSTATNKSNYTITGPAGNLAIISATLLSDNTNVLLTTANLTLGSQYTLKVSNIKDRSAAGNTITPNSQTIFIVASFTGTNIGSPAIVGSFIEAGTNGFDITGAGSDIGGYSDQFTFGYQPKTGDFDVKVRVASISFSDAWAKAALMARDSMAANSAFAAAVASPSINGCYFLSRSSLGVNASFSGSFPVNYPYTFLRLKRTGSTFTGYASLDGNNWVQLGTLSWAAPSLVYVGMAVTSKDPTNPITVQFRDVGDVYSGTIVSSVPLPVEPLGHSSRKTGLVISEIMYNPREIKRVNNGQTNNLALEFIEIYNANPFFENIGGFRITGDIEFTFPTNTIIKGGEFIVLAKSKSDVESYYGIKNVYQYGITNYITNYVDGGAIVTQDLVNGLNKNGGKIELRNHVNAVLLKVNFNNHLPWPIGADGCGHSLVLARPSYGENDPKAWAQSDVVDGSPGRADPYGLEPLRNITINEFLAFSSSQAFIELYNHSSSSIDISGAKITTSRGALFNTNLINAFIIPQGTIVPPKGFKVFYKSQFNFDIDSTGGRIYLMNPSLTRIIDAVEYKGQMQGISSGRTPDGYYDISLLASPTPGTNNTAIWHSDVIINEIMYEPISGNNDDEYIELYNRGTNTISLAQWKFTDGITFTFPTNAIIQPGGYIVAGKNITNLFSKYQQLNPANTFGNYSGSLANKGEHVELSMPFTYVFTNELSLVVTQINYIVANEVSYKSGGRWGNWSDGGGSSLELKDPNSDNRYAANWADSEESDKSSNLWTTIQYTGPIGETLGSPVNDSVHVYLLGIGECLVDDVEVISGGANLVINPGFENGITSWYPQGSHDMSDVDNIGYNSSMSLHIRGASRGDPGDNRVRSQTFAVNASGTITIRAKARWLRGWPELLVRLHGGGAEAYGTMQLPSNLGSPGLPNSKLISNAGPAIFDVTHTPPLPAANETVVVTARISDPDGINSIQVIYRNDSTSGSPTPVNMVDDGTSGDAVANDGIYSAQIPGQSAGTVIAFYLQAVDKKGATNLFPQDVFPPSGIPRCFPNDGVTRECVVRFGDTQMPGSFATYHFWTTSANRNRWATRDRLNNSVMDATFVLNNYRVVYNFKPNYGGSPWHNGQMTTGPDGSQRVDFAVSFPDDDLLFGAVDFTWCNPGNPDGTTFSDKSMQSEQTSYEIFKGIGIHYNYRKYVHLFVNGSQRSTSSDRSGNLLFEDGQQPNGDVVEEWYPDDTDGELFKIEDWFEFVVNSYSFSNNDADLTRRTVVLNGQPTLVIAPYRFMWRRRAVGAGESANDYTNFFKMVDAVSPASNPTVSSFSDTRDIESIINIEQWMRSMACQHTVGNWDSYGYRRGKNGYTYKGVNGRFELMSWDIDFTMGIGGDGATYQLFETTDPRVSAMWNTIPFLRAYWRSFYDICNGPLNNSYLDPIIDAKAAAMAANNINYDPNQISTIKSYIPSRRTYILGLIPTAPFAISLPNNYTTNNNYINLRGTAPVNIKTIKINGYEYPISWTSVTNWQTTIVLNNTGTNAITIQGYDLNGNLIPGTTVTNYLIYNGDTSQPQGNVVFNEIMYNPTNNGAAYIEIFNNSANFTFDLSGWRINGVGYVFPYGSFIAPRSFIVIAKDMYIFQQTYGFYPFDVFPGALQNDGETLTLLKPEVDSNGKTNEVIIDRVRYESLPPWPTLANGQSAALQLIDSTNDNSRVANWSDGMGWRYFSTTATNTTSYKKLYLFLDTKGDIYVDDIKLVAGTIPEVGDNLVRNGDFENPILTTNQGGYWAFAGNNSTNSTIVTDLSHSGSACLHIIQNANGSPTQCILQDTLLSSNGLYSISFWYLPTTNATKFTARMSSYLRPEVSVKPMLYTPGTNNSIAAPLPSFDPIWLNEVQAENITGIVDNYGEHDPWLEIYNSGTNTIDLSSYYLTDSYQNLTKWQFPQGTTINAGEFKIIWLDGQQNQSTSESIHTAFRISSTNGSIAITKFLSSTYAVIDYLNYKNLPADYSYGDGPDGQPFYRQKFYYPTAGGTNDMRIAPIRVYINEWMADNASTIINSATGGYDDWFELYNAETNAIDLSGYYLSDDPANWTQYEIPNGCIIPPKGFLLIWADNNPTTTNLVMPTDVHVNFALSRGGESIGLFGPDGSIIDLVEFGSLGTDLSEGRYPDGGASIRFLRQATPGRTNSLPESIVNSAPTIEPIGDKTVVINQTLRFNITATDPDLPLQQLSYQIVSGATGATIDPISGEFSWTPTVVGTNVFTVRVTDNGEPPLEDTESFTVIVNLTGNQAPILDAIGNKTVDEGSLLTFTAHATDELGQTLRYSLGAGAPNGASIDAVSGIFSWTPTELQGPGVYSVTVIVTDDGTPQMSDSETIQIIVREVNSAPAILPIGTQYLVVGQQLNLMVVGTDSDVPVQNLRYSLEAGAPTGMTIDSTSGQLSWTATTSAVGTNTVSVKVSDDGNPVMSNTRSFQIVVGAKPKLEVSRINSNGEKIKISFDSLPDKRYQLEYTDSLGSNWLTNTILTGTGGKLSITNSVNSPKQRFYRTRVLD